MDIERRHALHCAVGVCALGSWQRGSWEPARMTRAVALEAGAERQPVWRRLIVGAAKFALTTKTEHPYNVRILDMYTMLITGPSLTCVPKIPVVAAVASVRG
jgi:hypothetical protein